MKALKWFLPTLGIIAVVCGIIAIMKAVNNKHFLALRIENLEQT